MIDKSVHSEFSSIKLDQLVYVELEARNGGMMLTVSEEGFTFRAVTSVHPSGRISFSFIINGNEKLEGYGEIKWTKDEGKVAGLQFTDISTEFLNALRRWLAQLSTPVVPSVAAPTNNSFDLDPSLRAESTKSSAPEPIAGTAASREFGRNSGQSFDNGAAQNEVAQGSASEATAATLPRSTWITSEWNYPDGLQEDTRSRGNGVVIAAVVACFLLLAILLYSFRENIGRSLISLGQKLSAPSETSQAEPPDTKPAEAAQQPAPTNGTKENNPAPQSQATSSAAEKPEAIQPREDREKTASPPTKAEPTFKDERPGPSTEESAAKDTRNLSPAEQVRELWSQVGQGNTSAEVTLAKLYLIGGGVSKNCDQARVLLRAAAKKGNPEAISKLSQITRQGCP
jgi:PilZ domain